MLRSICFSLISFVLMHNLNAQQFGTFVDSRDDKGYKTVKIGEKEWMTGNLNVEKFQNGDLIPNAKTKEEWIKAGKDKMPAWCYLNNNPSNGVEYGRLYNWYAVIDKRGLAPKGWHIPTSKEFEQLIINWEPYRGIVSPPEISEHGEDVWKKVSESKEETKIDKNQIYYRRFFKHHYKSRNEVGNFESFWEYGGWWSSTEKSTEMALGCTQNSCIACSYNYRNELNKNIGLSVICIRD